MQTDKHIVTFIYQQVLGLVKEISLLQGIEQKFKFLLKKCVHI